MAKHKQDQDCGRAGWIFGGCAFKPRYDVSAPKLPPYDRLTLSTAQIEAFRAQTYVRDVCERCGKTLERAQ